MMEDEVKQYLFRLYHRPIRAQDCNFSLVLADEIELNNEQVEIYYTDYPCSLPETTTDLARQASILAYADCLLHLRSYVWMVVVWELSDQHGADNKTPVIILHPYMDSRMWPPDLSNFEQGYLEYPLPDPPDEVWTFDFSNMTFGKGFHSYELRDYGYRSSNNYVEPDPWTVTSIAREVLTGRYQQQFFKRSVGREDFMICFDNSIRLNPAGILTVTRFPLWRATIESIPNGHSGYSVDNTGKLQGQPQALTRRVLNGISNMAQQRRMFIRRDRAVSAVSQSWIDTCRMMLAWFWFNDKYAWQTPLEITSYAVPFEPQETITATRVPWEYLATNLRFAIRFLNLVNVAQGDKGLVLSLPGMTEEELETEYQSLLDDLRDDTGSVTRYAVRNITEHINVFRHAVDLMAGIINTLLEFRSGVYAIEQEGTAGNRETQYDRATRLLNLYNGLALAWPGLVADFYSVFCLLCTWQLTWNVAEKTRGADATDVLRNKQRPYTPLFARFPQFEGAFLPLSQHPDINTAADSRRPIFVPFRTWEISLYPNDTDAGLAAAQHQDRLDAMEAYTQQLNNERIAREAAARAARAQYLSEWRDERANRGYANPDDVWDYRNYSDWEWWKQKAQEPLNLEFTLRAIDVPNELLNPWALGLGLARNYVPGFSPYSDANGWNEKHTPSGNPVGALPWSVVTVLTRGPGASGPAIAWQIVGDAAGALADYEGTNDETYDPRQFWPPVSFQW